MVELVRRKRIDILIDAPLCKWLAETAAGVGISHYTLASLVAGMGHGGAKEDGFAGQHAVGVFDGLFHELAHDQGVGAFVDDLFFKLSAF